MTTSEIPRLLEFIKQTERLKDTLRTGFTTEGRSESVAEHTWRLCVMAVLFHNRFFPELDFQKLIKICLIHDLGEALHGDIPAPLQSKTKQKSESERQDLLTILAYLPEDLAAEFAGLWEEI